MGIKASACMHKKLLLSWGGGGPKVEKGSHKHDKCTCSCICTWRHN